MAETTVSTPYATAVALVPGDLPSWVDEYNAQRLAAYNLYDDLYANNPDANIALLRGSDEPPIFVPTAKRLINTLARYVGRGWGYEVDPELGTPADQLSLKTELSNLFRRERILSQFASGKRELLRRGDWVWYLTADMNKVQGKRLTLRTIDPRTYFPIMESDVSDGGDPDRLVGAQIIEETVLEDGKTLAVKVQTYYKASHPESAFYKEDGAYTGEEPIEYESVVYALESWNDPEKRKLLITNVPLAPMPGITSLPLYHVKNKPEAGNPFGYSEMSGLETIIAGISQAITDEDLALSISGLGQFVTDSGAPVDPTTKLPTTWKLGPQAVVEVGTGKKFERLAGVTSIDPVQKHVAYLEEQVYGSSGVNDIALGRGSVQLSGIAMAIKMAPLFDAADDSDLQINDVWTQLLYDLTTQWYPTYEQTSFGDAVATSATDGGDRLPFDREARWNELVTGYTAGIFPLAFIHRELVKKFGMDLTPEDLQDALDEAASKAAQADPYADRTDDELSADDTTEPSDGEPGA